jgi:hypothetical protein
MFGSRGLYTRWRSLMSDVVAPASAVANHVQTMSPEKTKSG